PNFEIFHQRTIVTVPFSAIGWFFSGVAPRLYGLPMHSTFSRDLSRKNFEVFGKFDERTPDDVRSRTCTPVVSIKQPTLTGTANVAGWEVAICASWVVVVVIL
ncbi:unnamed protein product, partial [Ectocarpus sp. 12 AP-2014]